MLLCAGVLKNSSNSLLPDITASTTFSFGAARQLKSGSVMDILGGANSYSSIIASNPALR